MGRVLEKKYFTLLKLNSKIPNGLNQNSYRTQQQGYLYSDRPMNDVVIKKIRVKPSQED